MHFKYFRYVFPFFLATMLMTGCRDAKTVSQDELNKYRTDSAITDTSLSDTPIAETETYESGEEIGILKIQDAKINIPLFSVDLKDNPELAQKIADESNKATYFEYGVEHVICNHPEDGFENLETLKENTSKATIEWKDGNTDTYICTAVRNGVNDIQLKLLTGDSLEDINEDGIAIYTYVGKFNDIVISFWEKC